MLSDSLRAEISQWQVCDRASTGPKDNYLERKSFHNDLAHLLPVEKKGPGSRYTDSGAAATGPSSWSLPGRSRRGGGPGKKSVAKARRQTHRSGTKSEDLHVTHQLPSKAFARKGM